MTNQMESLSAIARSEVVTRIDRRYACYQFERCSTPQPKEETRHKHYVMGMMRKRDPERYRQYQLPTLRIDLGD